MSNDSPDHPHPVPTTPFARAGNIATLGLFAFAILYTLYFTSQLAIPIAAAFILNLLLRPLIRSLSRLRIPHPVGAFALILALFIGLGMAFYSLSQPASNWLDRAPQIASQIRAKLVDLRRPVEDAQRASKQVEDLAKLDGDSSPPEVVIKEPGLLETLSADLGEVVGGLALMFVLLFFLLASGDTFRSKLVEAAPTFTDKRRALGTMLQIEDDVSHYLAMTTAINACLGLVVGLLLFASGLPNAALWGVMAFLLNFVPYLGGVVGVSVVAVVSLITFDTLLPALIPPALYALCNAAEGQFITPSVLGRRLAMNPVFVFLSVVFWAWMWGVAGALLAVPLLVCVRALCNNVGALNPLAEILAPRRKHMS